MGLDEGVDLVVGKHDVDALALEARVHPVVIPPGIEQVTGCLAFHALDLDEAGVAARVVGMDAVFLGDGPRLVVLCGRRCLIRLRPSSNVPLPTPLPLPKGAQLKVYWSTSSPPAPVTSFIKMPLSNQLVSEMLVTLTDLHTPMVRRAALHFGKEGPAERRIRVQTHGAEHARAHAERGALHEFASVHIVPPIEPE